MSNSAQRKLAGLLVVAFVIVVMGVILLVPPSQSEDPPIIWDPVPHSENPPENYTSIETIQVGPLILNATGTISGMIPHNGPITFNVHLTINVTNNGTEDVSNFHAIKMSLYYQSSGLFYTFSISPDVNNTIFAGETVTLNYQNQETSLDASFSLTSLVYARVLVTFDTDQECIITTPILDGIFAIE